VIEHQFDDDAQPAAVRGVEETFEILERAVARVNLAVVRDVVAVVAQGRRKEGEEPEAGDAERLDVFELVDQPRKVTDAIVIRVVEGLDRQFVDDGLLIPVRLAHVPSL
jgi:hypothetical protein